MLTGERRPVSGRRGMTVLGKVPKPVNLPSQRLENRGMDPNVEIVPRGSVSWGAAGSPPTSTGPWGNSTQSSSPPVNGGPWGGAPPRPSTAGSSGSATASNGPGIASSGGPWGGHPPRPSSAGSGTRPSSAGSLRQTQETVAAANAWGPVTARPSSASGVLGEAQLQSSVARPRSAETRLSGGQAPTLTRFAEQTNGPAATPPAAPPAAWGGAGTARKLGEEPHQPARFTLTRVDFPTLGSEKNPDLRPQQNKTGGTLGDRTPSVDERVPPAEEKPPSGPSEEPLPTSPGAYGGQERMLEGWRRDVRPFGSHLGMAEGSWHRDGPPPMQPYAGGQPQVADTWRREAGHGAAPGGGPSDDNWRRGGPPVSPYGPPGLGRFQPDPGYMHQQRYGPAHGPGLYGRTGGPGPGGFGRHGDIYGNAVSYGRPGGVAPSRPGPSMGSSMYLGPYDNFYGLPGPSYGKMDEREMMILGMSGPPGLYGNYPQGPQGEGYGRCPQGGLGAGTRHMGMNRERNDPMGYEGEGYREEPKYKDNATFKDGESYKDGGAYTTEGGSSMDGSRVTPYQDPGESHRAGHISSSNLTSEMQRPSSSGMQRPSSRGSHRDWGAAASSDEPMDFSKPVFEEDISSAGPVCKSGSSELRVDTGTTRTCNASKPDHLKNGDSLDLAVEKVVNGGESKDSAIVHAYKSNVDDVQTWKQEDVELGMSVLRNSVDDVSLLETKDQLAKKGRLSEVSDTLEKRWAKDSRQTIRERSLGRDPVFLPHAGRSKGSKESNAATSGAIPAVTNTSRSGQHISGSTSSGQILAISSQISISSADTLVTEEVDSLPELEQLHSSDLASPSGSDGQKYTDKVRILKRAGDGPESPDCETLNVTETLYTEVAALPTSAEARMKDDSKPKIKTVNYHDGEKEWRPKVLLVGDTTTEVPRPSSEENSKESSSGSFSSVGATVAAEKAGLDDSYDYEAQRARMKEIAAQRAIQLRKEEDERIKEQKAKALAKLEELNRRSLMAPVSQATEEPTLGEPTEELACAIVKAEENEVVVSEVLIEDMIENVGGGRGLSSQRGGVRSGRNEHGKRERVGDRKSNGRNREEHRVKMGSAEHREPTKARTTMCSQLNTERAPPPLLAQQGTTQASQLSLSTGHTTQHQDPLGGPSIESVGSLDTLVQVQVPSKVQEARRRGKQSASQLKQAARQVPASVEAEHPTRGQGANTEKSGGWPVGTNFLLDLDSKDVTLSLGSSVTSTEGVAAPRKKKTKNSGRNKQKLEGLTVSTDSTSSVDANQGWNVDLSSSNESGNEAGKPTLKAVSLSGGNDVVKVALLSVSRKDMGPPDLKSEFVATEHSATIEIPGSDGVSLRANGAVPSRRPQRKSQLARRVPVKERGNSQDVRVGDKPHGAEGMIWAPVRSPSGVHPAGSKGGFGSDVTSSSTVVEKKEEIVIAPHTSRARRAELERYTPKPVVKQQAQQLEEVQQKLQSSPVPQHQRNESANVPVTNEVPQNSSCLPEIKFGSEARLADTSIKQSRAHASWRQRSSGSERFSTHKETNQVQHSEPVETSGKSQQQSHHNQKQHNYHRSRPQSAMSEQSCPGSSYQSREVGRNQPTASLPEKEQHHPEAPQQGRSLRSHLPAAAPAASEGEPKNLQEGVAPYQPPRPGSSQKNKGLECDVQSSHEHVRSYRTNISQVDRQHGAPGRFDRDHHSSHERGPGQQQSRPQSFKQQQSSVFHNRDQSQGHPGSHQQARSTTPAQPSSPDGIRTTEGKDPHKSGSQSLHEKHIAPSLIGQERSHVDQVWAQPQPRSPPRQRGRQQVVAHEREQIPVPHTHQQSRYRQSGHERDHQREVPNAVHQQQHQRGTPDSHWQQTTGAEHMNPIRDFGHTNEHPTKPTFHKSQGTSDGSVDKDHLPSRPGSQQHTNRLDSQNKSQGPAANDSQKHTQYQLGSQIQRPHQQGSQASKLDNAHNSSHWNGERSGSPQGVRGREHGHSRRGRYGGRYSGPGRGGDFEHRREQLSKQRLPVNAAGGAVTSQVGG